MNSSFVVMKLVSLNRLFYSRAIEIGFKTAVVSKKILRDQILMIQCGKLTDFDKCCVIARKPSICDESL